MTLEEILEKIGKNIIPIILLDWNVVKGKGKEGYHGHFVPIIGYDKNNVYVHNPGLDNPTNCLPIKKYLFEKARKSKGTDEDIIIIHRKN